MNGQAPNTIVAGNPAKFLRFITEDKSKAMANPMKVPFLDLVTPHEELEDELLAVVKKVLVWMFTPLLEWAVPIMMEGVRPKNIP